MVDFSLEKRAIICTVYFGSTHILFIWKPFFEKNPTVPEPLGLDENETLMTLLLFLMTLHFRAGHALSNQRISGPVNTHLTPSPGICFNVLYMYIAPGQGQTAPWGLMLMSTVISYHFVPIVASFIKFPFKMKVLPSHPSCNHLRQ